MGSPFLETLLDLFILGVIGVFFVIPFIIHHSSGK